jgi:methyl-accepting chemotaxis protein
MAIIDVLLPRRAETESDFRLHAQLPYVAYTDLTLFFLYLLLELVLFLNFGLSAVVLVLGAALLTVIAALRLLRRGRYRSAATLTTVSLIWATCVFLYLMPYVGNNAREIYRGLAFAAVLATINMAVSLRKSQLWLFFAAFGTAWMLAFFTIFAHYFTDDRPEYLSILFAGTIGFVCENFMLILIRNLSERMVAKAEEQTRKSAESLQRLTDLISQAKQGMSIGGQVIEATDLAQTAASKVSQIQDFLSDESRRLIGETESLIGSSQIVLSSTRRIEEALSSQNAAITETSAALVQVTQNMESINRVANQRRSRLSEAAKAGHAQRELIEKLGKAFDSVRESSEGIRRFTATVQDIASRTSLLSMNASIEAARAGASGKGFAVVAQEIRGLSGETQKNSDMIQEMIKRNEQTVGETGTLVAEFSAFVVRNIEETAALIDSIDEILNGLGEMSTGTGEVMEAIKAIVKEMQASNEMAKEVVLQIDGQRKGFDHLSLFTKELDGRIASLRDAVAEIRASTDRVSEAGKLNIEQVKKLQLGDLTE